MKMTLILVIKSHVLAGDLKLVRRNTNPNLFSYRYYAISKGIGLEFKPRNLNQEVIRTRSSNIFLSLRRSLQLMYIGFLGETYPKILLTLLFR